MDDFSILDERIDAALKELKVINKYLGGISTTRAALKYFINAENQGLKILDIGSGSSDNLIAVRRKYSKLQIFSIDKNIRALSSSKNSLSKINSNAFHLPFKNKSCDIIHIALFIHHFTEEQIQILLKEFLRICKKGIIINDLQRSFLALWGIKILTFLFSKSDMVKNDAPLSVKRGFTKPELLKLFSSDSSSKIIIKKMWAFRWMVVIKK
jgi:ubiquinone/menaquinone biosynthesis C-methylase UbiE